MRLVLFLLITYFYPAIVNSSPEKPSAEDLDVENELSNHLSPLAIATSASPENLVALETPAEQNVQTNPTNPSDLEKSSHQVNPTDELNPLDPVQVASLGTSDKSCGPRSTQSSRKMRREDICGAEDSTSDFSLRSKEDFICQPPWVTLCCDGGLRYFRYRMGCIYCSKFSSSTQEMNIYKITRGQIPLLLIIAAPPGLFTVVYFILE